MIPAALRINAALGTLAMMPADVSEPVTVTLSFCPAASEPAETVKLVFVSGVPLYILLDDPAVMLIGRCVTVNVPGCDRGSKFWKKPVTSCVPFQSLYADILFADSPAFVCEPATVAVTLVTPGGSALLLKPDTTSGVPSYTLEPLFAVSVITAVLGMTVSVPSIRFASV